MRRILHISNDDKYISLGKRIFDQVPAVENTYWIIPGTNHTIQNVSFAHENLALKNLNSSYYHDQINSYDLICIHFLNLEVYPVLRSKKITTPILWIGWGGDYYWLIDTCPDFNLLLPHTRKWVHHIFLGNKLTSFVKKLKKIKRSPKLQAVNQISYFAPIYSAEFQSIKKTYPNFKPQFLEWNYGYIDQDIIAYYTPLRRYGDVVMIGNSATPTNNHLDIFEDLSHVLQEAEIILPLNYGDTSYKKHISKVAKEKFGDRAMILNDFISTKDFDKELLKCRNLIIGSNRQQAVGTIITALYLGLNVFLYKNSFNYDFFKTMGFYVYSIEDLIAQPQLLQSQLQDEQILENREKINQCWSIEKNVNSITNLLQSIANL